MSTSVISVCPGWEGQTALGSNTKGRGKHRSQRTHGKEEARITQLRSNQLISRGI